MFTGIVEEIGTVLYARKGPKSMKLAVRAKTVLEDLKVGDSVAISGVCLTATSVSGGAFTADVSGETLSRSNLGELAAGARVNLERAVALGGRLGGHIVTGHVDGTGRIAAVERAEGAVHVSISAPERVMRYIVEKGSVAVDGISLTVASAGRDGFAVAVIPHTGKATTLLSKSPGDTVNLECDIIGKYVEKLLSKSAEEKAAGGGLTYELLKTMGF